MDLYNLGSILDAFTKTWQTAAEASNDPIAKALAAAIGLAADLAKAGYDPSSEIEAMKKSSALLRPMYDEWKKAMNERFGGETEPPKPDPYED